MIVRRAREVADIDVAVSRIGAKETYGQRLPGRGGVLTLRKEVGSVRSEVEVVIDHQMPPHRTHVGHFDQRLEEDRLLHAKAPVHHARNLTGSRQAEDIAWKQDTL